MTFVKPIKIGWKALESILNDLIVAAINERSPSKGDGINVSESPTGFIISIDRGVIATMIANAAASTSVGAGTGNSGSTGGGSGAGSDGSWLTIDVMDGSCIRSTIQVWAKTS